VVVIAVFPFYYAVKTSFTPSSELFHVELWPSRLDFTNYVQIFTQKSFLQAIFNSIVVATSVVFIALLLGITASYALGRVRFRGRSTVLLVILGVSMFPQVAVLSGLFEVIRALNLYNNPGALILSYTIFTLPFTVWVLTTFMRQLPMELEEAAIMDGATPWVIITKVFLPLMWPAMATTGLLAFIAAWNEFLFALTFTLTDSQRTVPVAIALLSGGSAYELPWGPIMAASVVVTVPLVILVIIFQRRIVSGLTAGAVKG
ncbi:carbohydrate ABC transporter permease, partial [Halomonas sp. BC04]|uniref:carbohydrate ABC transporter permease n=1 Tax=Halomonas sp. BC04 TaxID=1403540 RepID=UPI0003ED6D84